jgi:Protein of unknown function (DUF1559)/Domain of unknown function (DUF4190)
MDPSVPLPPTQPRTSGMAITSLVLGVSSFFCWLFTGLPALILGVISLRKIYRSNGQLKGEGLAIGGIVCGGITTFLIAPVMVALLLPAVQAAREAARRSVSGNNLKIISLGMHNYADQHGALPPAGGGAAPGSQLSWRVRILPMIEEQALYEQFHLDEPWDSEHNRTLLAKMPNVFRSPNEDLPAGQTHYLAVTGPGTAFDDPAVGRAMRDFRDGISNTILVVEADQGVEWTRPDDWQFDPAAPTGGLGKLRPRGFLAAFADGHIEFMSDDTPASAVGALMTREGGETVTVP